MTEQIVHARGLTRDFVVRSGGWRRTKRVVHAVVDLDLDIAAGEAVGYIGANGAGKSTTIKMLTGILSPSAGTVETCGLQPQRSRRELAREIGVVFGQRSQLWWDLPLWESYRVLASIHRLGSDHTERLDELVSALDLAEFLDTPVRQLSLGQRIRGEIAAALLHSPRLLILDEPTIGLDVLSKERLRAFLVAERAAHGTTLLLTTHDMDDVQRLTERIVVVDHGRVAYSGDLPGLVRRVGADRVIVLDLEEPTASLADVAGTRLIGTEPDGLRQRLALLPGSSAAAVLAEVARRAPLRDLTIEEPDIEDVVRRLYATQQAPR
jgi:ABC-2 type transport system ATP-binding protein